MDRRKFVSRDTVEVTKIEEIQDKNLFSMEYSTLSSKYPINDKEEGCSVWIIGQVSEQNWL